MSVDKIRIALQVSVNSIVPAIDTVWENVPYAVKPGVHYQAVFLKTVPYNPVYGTVLTTRYNGILYVRLFMANDTLKPKGTKLITDRALLLLDKFKIGSSHINSNVECIIEETPDFNTEGADGDRFKGLFTAKFFTNLL
jgi:hypothetical protein